MPLTLSSSGQNTGGLIITGSSTTGGLQWTFQPPAVDFIRSQLSSTLATYDTSPVNNWVRVTKTEYDNIAANLSGVTKIGNTDEQINTRAVLTGWEVTTFGTVDANTPLTVLPNQYIIGFIAESWNQTGTINLGYTTTFATGSPVYMSNSPTVVGGVRSYYIRKAPTGVEAAPATQNLYPVLRFNPPTFPNAVPNTFGYRTSDNGTTWILLPTSQVAKIQLLVTSIKSW